MNKIVFCAIHEAGVETLKYLLKSSISIDYIVTLEKSHPAIKDISGFFDYTDLASKNNIPIYYANKYSLKDQSDIDFFQKLKFDLLIQGGWQRLFPPEVLKTLRVGGIGAHGSEAFLPKGRGRSPVNWTLIKGYKYLANI